MFQEKKDLKNYSREDAIDRKNKITLNGQKTKRENENKERRTYESIYCPLQSESDKEKRTEGYGY
jgi:hypothetical protein